LYEFDCIKYIKYILLSNITIHFEYFKHIKRCPYSERVWLALEVKNIPYNEIRIENSGYGRRPSYFSGQTPQIRWPGGLVQGESMDLVRSLDEKYPDDGLNLYPTDIKDEVEEKIREFRNIFPKGARPSSRAAYLFRFDGEPLWKDEFERVLKDTDALLGVNADDGPFFCGSRFTAADIAWCPFLERYAAQLPCLHDGLNPYDTKSYPHLVTWYDAMNELIPEYPCRIKGDASSWRKVLTTAGYGNAGSVPSTVLKRMQEGSLRDISIPLSTDEEKLHQSIWDTYAASRPWVSNNPAMEAASIVTRNREAIIMDFSKRKNSNGNIEIEKGLPVVGDELDTCMRAIVCLLCKDNFGEDIMKECSDVSGVRELTLFLDERMCVPRDMGSLSAQSMKKLFLN